MIETPVALDALVFLLNKQNVVKSLTGKQVQDIYLGNITNWNELGGANYTELSTYQNGICFSPHYYKEYIILSILNRKQMENWGWSLAFGIITFIVGLSLTLQPALSMSVLAFYVGFVLLFRSVAAISFAIDMKGYGSRSWGGLLLFTVYLITQSIWITMGIHAILDLNGIFF